VKKLPLAVALFGLGACATAPDPDGGSGTPDLDSGISVDAGSCLPEAGADQDGDGFLFEDDCNDCNPEINPGAYDWPVDGRDDDCNGTPDDEPDTCDAEIALDTADAFAAARALGVCRTTTETGRHAKAWGLVDAKFVNPDGAPLPDPLSHGVLEKFGANEPAHGARMLALSSGTARDPSQPGYESILGYQKGYACGTPEGYPKESPACPGVVTGAARDGAALELVFRVPTNATRIEVDENFFTLEFPGYVCSKYNDFFVIDMDPKVPSYPDGNVAFDAEGNPISVNNALLQVCEPQVAGGKPFGCPLGTDQLFGTGFDTVDDEFSPAPHAATGWLTTRAEVVPGSTVRIRFAIWDSGDGNLDSTVLLDRLRWAKDGDPGTIPVPR
jgi:hypothetical protein